MTVYCPDNDLCVIKGNSTDRNTELKLFCKNGWTDIDISEWNNAQILYTIDAPSNDTIITTMPPMNTTELPSFNDTDFPDFNETDIFNITDEPSTNLTDIPSINATDITLVNITTTNTTNSTFDSTLAPPPESTIEFPDFNISSTMPFNDTETITTFIPIDNETYLNLNVMHCGDDYEFQCEIEDSFDCECPPITTSTPSIQIIPETSPGPTSKPTLNPLPSGQTRTPTGAAINGTSSTPSPTAENIDEWFVIGITFIVLFAVVACILAYFAWIFHRADDKAMKGGYHQTDQDQDHDEIEAGTFNQTR